MGLIEDGDTFNDKDYTKGTQTIQRQSTAPSNPLTGQMWFDTSVPKLKIYDGTDWISAGRAIDNDTIVQDSDKIRVNKPVKFLFEEHTDKNDWNVVKLVDNEPDSNDAGFDVGVTTTIDGREYKNSLNAYAYSSEYGEGDIIIKKDVDVSSGEILTIAFDLYSNDNGGGSRASLKIDGNTVASVYSNEDKEGSTRFDISSKSTVTIRIECDPDGGYEGSNTVTIGHILGKNEIKTIDKTGS